MYSRRRLDIKEYDAAREVQGLVPRDHAKTSDLRKITIKTGFTRAIPQ